MSTQLETLQQERDRDAQRIHELEQIIADPNIGAVKTSKAKVELSSLQKKRPGLAGKRLSVANLGKNHLVSKGTKRVEKDIRREEERRKREEEIRQLQEVLQNLHALESEERRREIEAQLKAAQEAIEAMDVEEMAKAYEDASTNSVASGGERSRPTEQSSFVLGDTVSTRNSIPEVDEEELELSPVESPPPHAVKKHVKRSSTCSTEPETPDTQTGPEVQLGDDNKAIPSQVLKQKLIIPDDDEIQQAMSKDSAVTTQSATSDDSYKGKEYYEAIIKELEAEISKLTYEAQEKESMMAHWAKQVESLAQKCVDIKEENDARIEELQDLNQMQEIELKQLRKEKEDSLGSLPAMKVDRRSMMSNASSKSRRFSTRASIDSSLSQRLKRASMTGNIDDQIREEAKIEMEALEAALKEMDGEKAELLNELKMLQAVLASVEGGGKEKRVEKLVYQLGCRKCNKQMNFVGTTEIDLMDTMMNHFKRVVKECKKQSKKKGKDKDGEEPDSPSKSKKEEWSKEFAEHFAKHCKPSLPRIKPLSEKEIMKVCQEIVKVEVLRRSDGAALMWEDAE